MSDTVQMYECNRLGTLACSEKQSDAASLPCINFPVSTSYREDW